MTTRTGAPWQRVDGKQRRLHHLLLALLLHGTLSACVSPASEPLLTDDAWTIVMLPDTQYYAWSTPDVFDAQTEWIAAHVAELDIRLVVHVGDLVDANRDGQWENARASMAALDGVVPYVVVPGNHDTGTSSAANDRSTLMNDYFPVDRPHMQEHLGGTFEPGRAENTYHLVDTPEGPWLVLGLEFGPRDSVLEWAKHVLDEHAGLPSLLTTHAYLYHDSTRMDHVHRPDQRGSPYHYGVAETGVNDGEEIWQKLVEPASQLELVLSGHVLGDGAGYLASERADGTVAHQMVANYQDALFPSGYLRIIRVKPDRFEVYAYSPLFDQYRRDEEHEFVMWR